MRHFRKLVLQLTAMNKARSNESPHPAAKRAAFAERRLPAGACLGSDAPGQSSRRLKQPSSTKNLDWFAFSARQIQDAPPLKTASAQLPHVRETVFQTVAGSDCIGEPTTPSLPFHVFGVSIWPPTQPAKFRSSDAVVVVEIHLPHPQVPGPRRHSAAGSTDKRLLDPVRFPQAEPCRLVDESECERAHVGLPDGNES